MKRRVISRAGIAVATGLVSLVMAAVPASAALTANSVAGGVLTVTSDGADPIAVTCAAGNVQVNGAPPASGVAPCASVTSMVITGGPGVNVINLSAVNTTAGNFTALTAVTINGGEGNDTITGSALGDTINGGQGTDVITGIEGNDTITGGAGDDNLNGGAGNDTIIWNNGDGSDIIDGGDGTDVVQVNGAAAGDNFTIAPGVPPRVAFARTNLGPFTLDIGTTETLDVNGLDGNDTVTASGALAGLIALDLAGDGGNDALTGADGADVIGGGAGDDELNGGAGADVLRGGDGNDVLTGGTGNDQLFGDAGSDVSIWNNGDGSDLVEGGAGVDGVQVNGAAAGDELAVGPNGPRVGLNRTNLGLFTLDIGSTENVAVSSLGGDDVVRVTPIPDVAVNLDGGPHATGDTLIVDAQGLAVDILPGKVSVAGRGLVTHSNFETVTVVNQGKRGYWLVASDGGIFSFGGARFFGSTGALRLNRPIVGMASTPHGDGYWLVASDGGIFSFGAAQFFGSTGALRLNQPIVGMAATPSGKGYFLVASDGGIFAFGDAIFRGSTGALRLNQPIRGMATTPSGNGYFLVAADGGIFAFGDAVFRGSTGALRLNQPIRGMATTPSGNGYWLVASDGGIFAFGDAVFRGSTGALRLNQPIVGMESTPLGNGYWLVASDGGIFAFGDAVFLGSTGGIRLNQPVVGMAGNGINAA